MIRNSARIALLALLTFAFIACGDTADDADDLELLALQAATVPELAVVSSVDASRYIGRWYQIAALPQPFNLSCNSCVTAQYAVTSANTLSVFNACRVGSVTGDFNTISGSAFVNDATGARLSVSFFFPFTSPYHIIALADDYSHAMVGDPGRGSLFILSRSPTLATATYDALVARAAELGFPTTNLRLTEHSGCTYFGD